MLNIGSLVLVCKEVNHGKSDQANIMLSLTEEAGELAQEIKISNGLRKGPHGPDGIIGEAVDVILCALDVIYSEHGYMPLNEINKIIDSKAKKWLNKQRTLKGDLK
jgi:NTP pyrophosphatase (non-canonical NTP hydrolase)